MNETLFVAYFVVWTVLAVGSTLFFRGRDPAFKRRWYVRVSVFNIIVIGGFILLLMTTFPTFSWTFFAAVTAFLGFVLWVVVFRTKVCPDCGKVCQPENLITPSLYCSNCGASLAEPTAS